jgi:hypothetical protein
VFENLLKEPKNISSENKHLISQYEQRKHNSIKEINQQLLTKVKSAIQDLVGPNMHRIKPTKPTESDWYAKLRPDPEYDEGAHEIKFYINHELQLSDQPWYHQRLFREDLTRLLKNEGDFLLRVNPLVLFKEI